MSFVLNIASIQYNEALVGANHPTLVDTLNRPLLSLLAASGDSPDGVAIQGYALKFHQHLASDIGSGTFRDSSLYKFIGPLNVAGGLIVPSDSANYPRTANLNLTLAMSLVGFDCTSASKTATLPPVASANGQTFTVFKIDVTANQLILAAQGGELISGAASKNTAAQWGKIQVISNGTIWIQLI